VPLALLMSTERYHRSRDDEPGILPDPSCSVHPRVGKSSPHRGGPCRSPDLGSDSSARRETQLRSEQSTRGFSFRLDEIRLEKPTI